MSLSKIVASRYLRARASLPEVLLISNKKPQERVAGAYLKQSSQVTFKLTYEENFGDGPFSSLHMIDAFSEGQEVGTFGVGLNLSDQKDFKSYTCRREMEELIAQNPSLVNSENKVYVAEVVSSSLDDGFQGQGLGVKGYLRLAQHIFQTRTNRTPFLFIPSYCSGTDRSTSEDAIRVWRSLARRLPSKGEVVLINK